MSSNNAPSSPHNSLEDNELTSSRLHAEPTIPQHIMPSQDLLVASHQYNHQAAILNGMAMNDICTFHLPPAVAQSNYTSYNPISSIRGGNNVDNNDDDKKLPPPKIDIADIKSAMAKAKKENKIDTIFKGKVAFPLMLTYMLESVEGIGKSHIIHWTPDDKFVIKDVDAFLTEILPKFFKSENAKIKSFYRKLNRWGFSMARKKANSPDNLWSHQVFTREIAVRALYESLETGVAIDFLSGSRRKSEKSLSDSQTTSDSLSTIATASITAPSVTTLHSMPTRLPSSTREKRHSQSMTTAQAHRESRKRLSHSWTSSNMQHDIQLMQQQHHAAQTGQPIGAVNATFDLISARTYDMLSSSSTGLNPTPNMFATREQVAQMYPHPALTGALSQAAMLPSEPMRQGLMLQAPEDAFSIPPPRSNFGNMGMQPNGTATRRHSAPISQVGNFGLSTNEDQELSEFFDMFAHDSGEDLTRGLDIPRSLSQQASQSNGQHNALRRIEESTLGTADSSSQEQQASDFNPQEYDTAIQNALALLQQLQNDKT